MKNICVMQSHKKLSLTKLLHTKRCTKVSMTTEPQHYVASKLYKLNVIIISIKWKKTTTDYTLMVYN